MLQVIRRNKNEKRVKNDDVLVESMYNLVGNKSTGIFVPELRKKHM